MRTKHYAFTAASVVLLVLVLATPSLAAQGNEIKCGAQLDEVIASDAVNKSATLVEVKGSNMSAIAAAKWAWALLDAVDVSKGTVTVRLWTPPVEVEVA